MSGFEKEKKREKKKVFMIPPNLIYTCTKSIAKTPDETRSNPRTNQITKKKK